LKYGVIGVGASWGGLHAVGRLLETLPEASWPPIVVAQHRSPESLRGELERLLQTRCRGSVREAGDKDVLEENVVYIAPPDYHLLVEPGWLSLSLEERVQHARPSVDVLFESIADAYRERAIGVVLTGANEDGAAGLARIKARGGVAIVQDPGEAERRAMPEAAIAATRGAADAVLPLEEMGRFLYGLCFVPEGVEARPRRPPFSSWTTVRRTSSRCRPSSSPSATNSSRPPRARRRCASCCAASSR
jgi:two-component system chemotaxis response regulator CheB